MTLLQDMQNQLEVAATVAFIQEAHRGQKYGDMPYLFHPVEVAGEVVRIAMLAETTVASFDYEFTLHEVQMAALLHDVIEDTEFGEAELRQRFSGRIVDAVVLLSLNEGLEYRENIQRIIDSDNIIALFVKLADNRVNRRSDKSKFKPEKARRLNDRYDMSMEMITAKLKEMGFNV